jgi:hypothetical protein
LSLGGLWADQVAVVDEYISVSSVMATHGFALTASPFWQTPQKEPKGLAPASGPSPRLGVPSLRSCSVGPPRSAILGLARLTRHPAGLPTAQNLHSAFRRGRQIKIKSCRRANARPVEWSIPVGASTLAKVVNDDAGCLMPRSVLNSIASMLAPTGLAVKQTWCEHPQPMWEPAKAA